MKTLYAVACCIVSAGHASAEDNEWNFAVTGNLWLPTTHIGVETPRGEVSGELSVKEALDALDFALMGSFEARRNQLGLIADLVYFDLSASQSTPLGGLFDRAGVDNKITGLTTLAVWRVQEANGFALDVGAGARMMWADVDVTLSGAALPTEISSRSDNWLDPIIALRARFDLNDKWFSTLYLDAGGFGAGSEETYQAAVSLGYSLNDRWSFQSGWRYLDFRRENDNDTLDFRQSGINLGATYRF